MTLFSQAMVAALVELTITPLIPLSFFGEVLDRVQLHNISRPAELTWGKPPYLAVLAL